IARNLSSQKLRQLPPGDRLKIRDSHQDKGVRARQFGPHRSAEGGANSFAKAQFRPKAPTAGDRDDLVGAPAQFVANIVDDELEVAGLADDARQCREPSWLENIELRAKKA